MSYKIDQAADCNRSGNVSAGVLTLLVDSATTIGLMTGEARLGGVSVDIAVSYLEQISKDCSRMISFSLSSKGEIDQRILRVGGNVKSYLYGPKNPLGHF